MSFLELIRVQCDGCGAVLVVPQADRLYGTLFHSHSQAVKFATRQNWYVDSIVVHCRVCRDFALEWFEFEQAQREPQLPEHTCCVCGAQIPWHYAVINCGGDNVACLSHEGDLRGWGSSKRCTFCSSDAVTSAQGQPVCMAHAKVRL